VVWQPVVVQPVLWQPVVMQPVVWQPSLVWQPVMMQPVVWQPSRASAAARLLLRESAASHAAPSSP